MKLSKLISPFRGLTATMAAILVLSTVGYGIADTYRGTVDDVLGTTSYEIDSENVTYKSDYDTIEDMAQAAKDIAVREGEEGTVIMKNDNSALPLSKSNDVALFGLAAYAPYPYSAGDLRGGNEDEVDLVTALTDAGFTVNSAVQGIYDSAMNKHWGVVDHIFYTTEGWMYDIAPTTSVGDMTTFTIGERSVEDMISVANANGNTTYTSESSLDNAVKSGTIGICAFARPGGESNTYAPGTAADWDGTETGKDPLALSDIELGVIESARKVCDKVIVLLNTGNEMEISAIAEGGDHEVDAIAYIGCPNDYQFTGIVKVLSGEVNSTGALADTFVYSNESIPAVQNFGGDEYADASIAESDGTDPRYSGTQIANGSSESFGGSAPSYAGNTYIVEAEGIYVGYKYYETRYYDSIMNPSYNASSTAGSSFSGQGWDYDKEVIYSFGHGLSYYDYTQKITSLEVDTNNTGNITATIEITNNSDTDAYFLGQLYVQKPYTEYDRTNLVEKSAVDFLSSGKVYVSAHSTGDVEITVPTKYLASYDYTKAETYILDEGTYYFTAAAGAHEAVNNILAEQGMTTNDGMDAAGDKDAVKTWNKNEFDSTTYAVENDYAITNEVQDFADMNSWLPGTVTYLSRQDWQGTYPKNYNTDVTISIAKSSRKDEWISQIRGQTYTIDNTGDEAENVDGKDNGYRFSAEQITYEDLTDINSDYWNNLVAQISVNEAVGAILHGGSRSDVLSIIDNPEVIQNEGVDGFTTGYTTADGTTYMFNVNSQTLLATSFNPELAYEWGLIEGNSGLWIQRYDIWGVGLTLRRTPYNGRNYEYISEDPMLANRIGYGVIAGTLEKGILCGPKHIGFNDQEHNRAGVAAYMNEQKFRETDMRAFQGGMDDANGLAVMVAFNRVGPVNGAHNSGMLLKIMRGEWGFKGLISTDMMSNAYYFDGASMVMSGVTQVADFSSGDSYISSTNDHSASDKNWAYITIDGCKNDTAFVNQARESLKYQLYAFANSAILNVSTIRVTPWWETAFNTITIVSAILTALFGVAWLACELIPKKKEG